MPQEYTPELSKSFLDSITGGIDEQGRVDEGRAASEAASRGLDEQGAYVGSAVGQVRAGVARDKTSAIGAFNMDVAGKTREERLTKQNRGWSVEDRDFGAVEAQKNRDFQEHLAQLGYQYGDASARRDKIYGEQGMVEGAAMKLGSSAINTGMTAMMMSDRRLKKNVVAVGKDGPLTVYEFDYLSAEHPELELPTTRMRGFMADEVKTHFPDAVVVSGGYMLVKRPFHPEAI